MQDIVQLTGAGLGVTVVILTMMITPIMIALICEALSSVPPSWREGAVALGLNPLRAVRAVTLRAIRPAIVAAAVLATARALGEAVMIQMVSGGQALQPQARRRHRLPVRAAAHARLGDRRLPRRRQLARARRRRVRVRAAAAVRCVRAVCRRLPGQAPAAQVPDARMSTPWTWRWREERPSPSAGASGRGRRSSPMSWRWGDRLVLVAAWAAGLLLCAIAGAIVVYMGVNGDPVPAPGPDLQPPAGQRRPGRLGRVPGPADRDRAADADRHRDRAAARARERRVDRRVRSGWAGSSVPGAGRRVEHRGASPARPTS